MIAISIFIGIGSLLFLLISIFVFVQSSEARNTKIVFVFCVTLFMNFLMGLVFITMVPDYDRLQKGEKEKYEHIEGSIYRKL